MNNLNRQELRYYNKRVTFHYDTLLRSYTNCFYFSSLPAIKAVAHDLAMVDLRKRRKKMKRMQYEQ